MNAVKVKAYAKINLTLDVLGVSDGYHDIDSVVASVDIYDLISVKKRRDDEVTVEMRGLGFNIPPNENNAYKAARAFQKCFNTCGVDITVWKNIPLGAGLGGSSADAAGVLNATSKLFGVTDFNAVKQIADGLGSDTGYMLGGGFARIGGRGTQIKMLNVKRTLYLGLIIPKDGVSTAECYALSDKLERANPTSDALERALVCGSDSEIGANLSNGLYAAAARLNGGVEKAYARLASFAPLGVNMTGSGSGVFAIFENDQFLQYARSRIGGDLIMTKTVLNRQEKE